MVDDNNKSLVVFRDPFYVFSCPHCGMLIQVNKKELNCKIFRCGVYKKTGKQIPPHAKRVLCDRLRNTKQIYGCARPFIFRGEYVEACEYI